MIKLLLILVALYVGSVAALYLGQRFILFPGARMPSTPLDQPRSPERLELISAAGDELRGMLFPSETHHTDLVIGFGGNAQDAERLGQDLADRLPDAHVVVFHYRGFGLSSGKPSQEGLFADALKVYDTMVARLKPDRTFLVGVSLGSGVATYLSSERPVAGMILVTPFDSVEAIAKANYFWVPVSLLMRDPFRSDSFMRDNRTPVAVIAVEGDRVVRPARTEAFRRVVPNLVFDRTLSGSSHATILDLPSYDVAFREAFDVLSRPTIPSLPGPSETR